MYKGKHLTVIIAAGGGGTRFGSNEPKQFLDMGGRSMLAAAAWPFVYGGHADEIIFTIPEGFKDYTYKLLAQEFCGVWIEREGVQTLEIETDGHRVMLRVVHGGKDRAASIRKGLGAASVTEGLVLIHDAARPFVSEPLICRVIEKAFTDGAAVPVVPIRDTIYITEDGTYAQEVPERKKLCAAQTPQGFEFSLIRDAHEHAFEQNIAVTDDGMPVLFGGGRVTLVEGDPANIKVTHPDDLSGYARLFAEGAIRVGIGFDAHRFVEGRPLILGGLEIPFEKGLAGHSDADVVAHSLMDAILGALGEGDIGKLFPDSDPAYKDISSVRLLDEVSVLMHEKGFEIVNADITIVTEQPRMAPYREAAENKLAQILNTSPENVSMKATTTEKLGFSGREEGIAAEAVVLLRKKEKGKGRA